MKIYVVIQLDHHTDADLSAFTRPTDAIDHARSILDEMDPDWRKDTAAENGIRWQGETLLESGWLFYGQYGTEGDCVYIEVLELDSEI